MEVARTGLSYRTQSQNKMVFIHRGKITFDGKSHPFT